MSANERVLAWISVSDRKPQPEPLSDIVFGSNGESVGLYRYWWRYGRFERLVTPDGWPREVSLTHWMPLPTLPTVPDEETK